jgi:hypothetical protein
MCVLVFIIQPVLAYSPTMRQTVLKGPWDIMVMSEGVDKEMRFPVSVPDENKSSVLDTVLPVIGSSVKIELKQYVPDLKWETKVVDKTDAGMILQVSIKGEGLDRTFWLDSADPSKQLVNSSIGSVAVKKLYDAETIKKLTKGPISPKTVGIVSIWPGGRDKPIESLVDMNETISIDGSEYKLSFLEYMPHYSVNSDTKEVTNLSERPSNPALKIRLESKQDTYEQWLWSKFQNSPHSRKELPIRVDFIDLDIGASSGRYIFLTADDTGLWTYYFKDNAIQVEKADMQKRYLFENEKYSFAIEQFNNSGVITNEWKNEAESLRNPAVIINIKEGDKEQEVVLEINKPHHYQSDSGTMLMLYKSKVGETKAGN